MKCYISKFLDNSNLDLTLDEYEIIIDIPNDKFLYNIKFLFLSLLYPLYHNKKTIIIDNIYEFNDNTKIDFSYVHEDINIVEMYIYLEAWNKLIENFDFIEHKYTQIYKIEGLNEYQQKAVDNIDGPFKLLAPAGSGKTKTLISRVLNLLNYGVKEESILILAFNKKAEIEVRERISIYSINNIEIKTFHSFCNSIIINNSDMEFACDDYDVINRCIVEEILFDNKINVKSVDDYFKLFSMFKNGLTNKDEMTFQNKNIYDIYNTYIQNLLDEKVYGFDDMVYLCIKLILENGKLRNELQNKYKYILVDEAQDLNNAQLLLIKLLSLSTNNLFIVGDDDQTIYGFRGANVEGILNFEEDYSCCTVETLKINYRSKANIVNNSRNFINHNKIRIEKDIIPFNKDNGIIDTFIGKDITDECQRIVKWVKDEQSKDISNNQIAILYRFHEYEDILKLYLIVNNIPMNLDGANFKIFDIILPFFKFFFDNPTIDDYKEIIKSQNYYVDNHAINKINDNNKFIRYLKRIGLKFLAYKLNILKKILGKGDISFKLFIYMFHLNKSDDNSYKNIIDTLNKFGKLKKIYKIVNTDYKNLINREDGITMSTIHKVKGNEFESVCYYHIITPTDEIEDERKISYVAFTRAKSNLFITSIKSDELLFIKEYFSK